MQPCDFIFGGQQPREGYRDCPIQSLRAKESTETIAPLPRNIWTNFREVIQYSVAENKPAAFFVEPIQVKKSLAIMKV